MSRLRWPRRQFSGEPAIPTTLKSLHSLNHDDDDEDNDEFDGDDEED